MNNGPERGGTEKGAPSGGLWDFSLALYAREGVPAACLRLQERHGLDVNLLFFCCWAGWRGRSLQPAELTAVHAEVAPWHDCVVRPLRHVRQWMKAQANFPASPEAQALREAIKAQELEAERLEQTRLGAFLSAGGGRGVGGGAGQGDPGAAVANLAAYLALHSVEPDVDDEAALVRLLVSAFPNLRPLSAFNLLRGERSLTV